MPFSRNRHLSRLSYYSLIAFALLPLTHFWSLSFWEVVRLLVITVGLMWLTRESHVSEASCCGDTFKMLLMSLVFMFILVQFIADRQGERWLGIIGGGLVGLACLGIYVSRVPLFKFTPLDRVVFMIIAAVVILKISTQLIFSPDSPGLSLSRWAWMFQAAQLLLVYFVISRIVYSQEAQYSVRRLFQIITLVLGLVSLGGIIQTVFVFYSSIQAVQTFKAGHYDRAQEYTLQSFEANASLQFPLSAPARTLTQMIGIARDAAQSEAYMAAGEIAETYHLWDLALMAYRGALDVASHSSQVRAALGNSLLENGFEKEALDLCQKAIDQPGATSGDYAGLALVLAKMGRWAQAYHVLSQAEELTTSVEAVRRKLSSGNGMASLALGQLLPESFFFALGRLTMFEVVKLLEGQGWKVFYLSMAIGSTDVKTPVDIVGVSGAGASFREESIRVGGEELSLRKRGYNLAVIAAETGHVEGTANFDTWGNVSDAHRLAGYIRDIPQGKIVIVTIHDEGSKELTDQAKAVFQTIGVNRFPQKWGSHAAIGVKGAAAGEGVQRIAEQNEVAQVGVMAGNVDLAVAEDPVRLTEILRKGAQESSAGMAVFIPYLGPDARILLSKR